jgi:hypothetical protein
MIVVVFATSRVRPRRLLQVIVTLAVTLCWTAPSAEAQLLPERYSGVWTQGACGEVGHVRLVNSLAVIDVLDRGGAPHLQILVLDEARPDGDAVDLNLRMADGTLVEGRFTLDGGRLDGAFRRCDAPPPPVAWTLGEVVTLFEAAGRVNRRCRDEGGARCVLEAFDAVDVTGDGVLREAEIARVLRVIGFFVGYAATERTLVPAQELLLPSALGGMLAPTIASGMVANYDYDGDGGLSLDELLEDRGDRAGLVAALQSAETIAADLSLDAAIGFVRNMAGPLLGSMPIP